MHFGRAILFGARFVLHIDRQSVVGVLLQPLVLCAERDAVWLVPSEELLLIVQGRRQEALYRRRLSHRERLL